MHTQELLEYNVGLSKISYLPNPTVCLYIAHLRLNIFMKRGSSDG